MSDNIIEMPEPPKRPEWIIGPFEEWRVVIEGRNIPHLKAFRQRDGSVTLLLDHRFGLDVPEDLAYQVASFVANALAIGAGYAWHGADAKFQPFAVGLSGLSEIPK